MTTTNDALLTTNELTQLNAFRNGADEPNTGYLSEVQVFTGKTLSDIVESLIAKDCIFCDDEDEGAWITVAPEWRREGEPFGNDGEEFEADGVTPRY